MFVVTFIVGNKTFFICIKTRHGFIHCSASQRVLVAATRISNGLCEEWKLKRTLQDMEAPERSLAFFS